MKRLLCIVGSMDAGGAETFLMKIFREINKNNYCMDFAVATDKIGFYDNEIIELGGIIHHITPKSKGVYKNFIDIKNIVKNYNYKYVLRVSQHSLSALELIAAKIGGAKYCAFRSSNTKTGGNKINEVTHIFFKFLPKLFANIKIAPSTESAKFMFGNSKDVYIIHNGIKIGEYAFNVNSRVYIRAELNLKNSDIVLGHIGRFNKQKNHEFIINVFSEVCKKMDNAYLLLIGKGELEEEVNHLVEKEGLSNKVMFLGVRNDIQSLLSSMDIFIFPSYYEGMPNTVIEAQCSGLKSLISDSITREVKLTNLVSFFSLKNCFELWAKQITGLLNVDAGEREKYSELLEEKGYDIKNVATQFIKVIFKS